MESSDLSLIKNSTHAPNLFLVGAAKAGTTTLANYLEAHPDIFLCPFKEPAFFVPYKRSVNSIDEYLNLFKPGAYNKYRLDASTIYLYPENVPGLIQQVSSHAKILIVLRNPVHAAYSYWQYMSVFGGENKSFEVAVSDEERAYRQSSAFAEECFNWWPSYLYVDRFLYFEQVKRYLDVFGQSKVKIVIFEDFIMNPELTLQSIYEFLNISDVPFNTMIKSNEGGGARFPFLIGQLKKDHPFVRRLMSPRLRFRLREFLKKISTSDKKRVDIEEATLGHLHAVFAEDARKLGSLIGVDTLERWGF